MALVRPGVGAAIVSLKVEDLEVMAQPPRAPLPPVRLGDENDWVRAWRGGWQLLTPNAGDRAVESDQGFHGAASQEPWQLIERDPGSARLGWAGLGGLTVERRVSVGPGELRVESVLHSETDRPLPVLLTEHVILGASLLDRPARIVADAPTTVALLDSDSPAQDWPGSTRDDWPSVSDRTPARCGLLGQVPSSGVEVLSSPLIARLTWDRTLLPYAWLWQEIGASKADPWFGEFRALGIEPSNCTSGRGLDWAVRTGSAPVIEPGASWSWWVLLDVRVEG